VNKIIHDIIKIESLYIYNNENNYNLYNDFKDSENVDIFYKIYELLKKNKRKIFINSFDHLISEIDKKIHINYNELKEIKNSSDLIIAYISIFVIVSMNTNTNKSLDKNKFKLNNIWDCCNKVEYLINKLKIFLQIKFEIRASNVTTQCITKIFRILINDEIIKEKNIFNNNKTIKFIYIENMNYISVKELYITNFKSLEYENEMWLYNETFWSFKKIFRENLYSKEKFHLENKDIINNLCNNYFYIDLIFLEEMYKSFMEENKIEKENIKEKYKNLIKEYANNLHSKKSLPNISKQISLCLKCFIFENIIKNYKDGVKYFIPFIIDFRGRKYDITEISPTFFTELRYCLHLGKYNFKIDIKKHILNEKIDEIINKYTNLISYDFVDDAEIKKKSYIWLLISLAEPFKNRIGSSISIEQFIVKGIEIEKNKKLVYELDYDDRIKCIYILKILDEIKKDIWVKRLIPKDATASVFQHLVKCLGKHNNESLKHCNMDSEDKWYDTYSIIIDKFNEKIEIKNISKEKYDKIFNRKNLKKTLMTRNYGCGLKKSFKYFNESIENILKESNDIEINEINVTFVKFYKYISENNSITKESINQIVNFFEKDKGIIFEDLAKTNYKYFKFKKKRIDSSVNGKRYTRVLQKLTNDEDNKKYKISIVANYIQSQDAALVRWILKRITIITIHDCFMIDYANITYLIALINEGMRIQFHTIVRNSETNSVFSIFIVI